MGDGSAFGLPSKADRAKRDQEARGLIDKILHGTPEGQVRPEISADMRQKLVEYPDDPSRALLEHLKTQSKAAGFEMNAALPEDLVDVN